MDKRYHIIDRSITEIAKRKIVDWPQLSYFAESLLNIGVEMLELDARSIQVMERKRFNFIYRISDLKDLSELHGKKPYAVIIKCDDVFKIPQQKINHNLIIEIEVNSLNVLREIKEKGLLDLVKRRYAPYCIRFCGMEDYEIWGDIKDICSFKEEVKIDICPYDTKGLATAIALDALEMKTDYLTTSFCGYGLGPVYAPTEEVIMALRVIYGVSQEGSTEKLTEMAEAFEELSGKRVGKQKPILGSNIFKCESGIHVDGIIKDPNTYEPYPPEMVGKKREFVVGKHSGRKRFQTDPS